MNKYLLFAAVLSLVGCANPYAQFYHGDTPEQVVLEHGAQPEKQPQLRSVEYSEYRHYSDLLSEEGYQLIGWSGFTGKAVSQDLALSKARELHADYVVVANQYRNTDHTAIPIVTPTTSTTHTTSNAYAYGSGGYANAYGNSTSTTYGQETTMMPVSTDIYQSAASFWIKAKPAPFGVSFRYANDSEKRSFGTNRGMVADIVVRGGAAYNADILKGDLILKVGPLELNTAEDLKKIRDYAGQEVPVVFIRNGETITKMVRLNPLS